VLASAVSLRLTFHSFNEPGLTFTDAFLGTGLVLSQTGAADLEDFFAHFFTFCGLSFMPSP
jgi:hypothetical protein